MQNFFKDNKYTFSQVIRRLASLKTSTPLNLWLSIKDIANGYGICVASQRALASFIGAKSRMTVNRATHYLVDHGYIGIGKIGAQRAYILNPNITQMMSGDTAKKALANHGMTFVGAIHLTKEENPGLYKRTLEFYKKCHRVSGKYSLNHIRNFRSSAMKKSRSPHDNKAREQAKLAIKRGWTTDMKQCKRLRKEGYKVGYQTSMFKREQNKKSVKK